MTMRPTSTDVARRAGVSRATVSYVLNRRSDQSIPESTRQRVLRAVDELGYSPHASARSLRSGRSNIVLMPMPAEPAGPAIDAFQDSVNSELAARGLCLLLHGDRTASGARGARQWAELRPAAVLAFADRCDAEGADLLRTAGVEAILLIGPAPVPHCPTLRFDVADAATAATDFLLDHGHRTLACLVPTGPLADLGERRYRAVATAAGARSAKVLRADCDLSDGSLDRLAARWRDPASRPDAVYAYNDEFALLLIAALSRQGVAVPGDIAVVGSGNMPLGALLRPGLTSTYFDMPAIGSVVADSVARLLAQEELPEEAGTVARPRLVRRESA
ncbi:LacI family DNA-binding transcriptional regulator [Streptomyces sp. NPDC101225]|uniref:LacI family DNA-binding transcriptional regulator n=1 Tax=Streptomyces sp. NPDC101225 TaxID=3366135 RepID=UPI0037F21597